MGDLQCFEVMFNDLKSNEGVVPIRTIEEVGSLYCPTLLNTFMLESTHKMANLTQNPLQFARERRRENLRTTGL